jgi:hypothetical protein
MSAPQMKVDADMAKFKATNKEMKIIERIAARALYMAKDLEISCDKKTLLMDIEACHCNGAKLDLKKLMSFDNSNFAHDVFGIHRHLDRNTGKLKNNFWPRSAAK